MNQIRIESILSEDKLDKEITHKVILYKGESYTFWDSGLTRYCFVNADRTKVIKILIDPRHKDYNEEEYNIYLHASKEKRRQLAETKMDDSRIIEQEFCMPIKMDKKRQLTIPQIVFAQSCRNEVGWTADGRLVCFDLDEYKKW